MPIMTQSPNPIWPNPIWPSSDSAILQNSSFLLYVNGVVGDGLVFEDRGVIVTVQVDRDRVRQRGLALVIGRDSVHIEGLLLSVKEAYRCSSDHSIVGTDI